MNKLILEKKYQQVIEIFEMQISQFNKERSNSKKTNNPSKNQVPYDQLNLMTEALICLVN
jgi:hypothetical protein